MPPRERSDVVIVGAGLEGLLLAVELQRPGLRVAVVEKRGAVGGRYRVVENEGFSLPIAIHFARHGAQGALGELLFRQGDSTLLRELGTSFSLTDTGVTELPLSIQVFSRTRLIGLRDRLRMMRLIVSLRSRADLAPVEDLDTWMAGRGFSPRLSALLRDIVASMVIHSHPGKVAAREVLESLRRSLDLGVTMTYPVEGWGRIVKSVTDRFLAGGGKLLTDWEVARIECKRGRVQGVVSSAGEAIGAPRVVWSSSPRDLLHQVDDLDPALRRSLATVRPLAATTLVLALSRPVSMTTGLWRLSNPSGWALFPSNLAGGIAPRGKQVLVACAPTMSPQSSTEEVAAAMERRLMEIFPGLETAIEIRRMHHLPRLHGTDVGVGATRTQRPPVAVPSPRGLFLVGDACAVPGLGDEIGFASVQRCLVALLGKDSENLPPPKIDTATEAGSALARKPRGVQPAES